MPGKATRGGKPVAPGSLSRRSYNVGDHFDATLERIVQSVPGVTNKSAACDWMAHAVGPLLDKLEAKRSRGKHPGPDATYPPEDLIV